jgi:hypothetical protein
MNQHFSYNSVNKNDSRGVAFILSFQPDIKGGVLKREVELYRYHGKEEEEKWLKGREQLASDFGTWLSRERYESSSKAQRLLGINQNTRFKKDSITRVSKIILPKGLVVLTSSIRPQDASYKSGGYHTFVPFEINKHLLNQIEIVETTSLAP